MATAAALAFEHGAAQRERWASAVKHGTGCMA
jgi:hypothetical protein